MPALFWFTGFGSAYLACKRLLAWGVDKYNVLLHGTFAFFSFVFVLSSYIIINI